jgi:hypothetical protein
MVHAHVQFRADLQRTRHDQTFGCPTDKERKPAETFKVYDASNVSYDIGNDANETRPNTILATDRSLSGFEFSGLWEKHSLLYHQYTAGGKMPSGTRRFATVPTLATSVSATAAPISFSDAALLNAIRSIHTKETVDGTLRFYVP